MYDAAVPGNDVRLYESNLAWRLYVKGGRVASVAFRRETENGTGSIAFGTRFAP
jgi:hypothetical protein